MAGEYVIKVLNPMDIMMLIFAKIVQKMVYGVFSVSVNCHHVPASYNSYGQLNSCSKKQHYSKSGVSFARKCAGFCSGGVAASLTWLM